MGNRDKKEKEKPKDCQAAAAIAVDKHETDQPVTMAVVRELLQAQESRLKSQFESVVQSLEKRVHDVEKSVKEIKTSLKYTQKDVETSPIKDCDGERRNKQAEHGLIVQVTFDGISGEPKPPQ